MSETDTGTITFTIRPHLAGFWHLSSNQPAASGYVYSTQYEALARARALARDRMPSRIVLLDLAGNLRAEYDYRDEPLTPRSPEPGPARKRQS